MKKFQSLWQQLQAYENVILIPHIYPDGDALGSTFGLQGLLQSYSTKQRVRVVGEHIQGTDWMGSFDVIPADHWAKSAVVFLDTATKELVYSPSAFNASSSLLIDHHPKTTPFYDDSFIETTATSTSEILARMAESLSLSMTPHTANCFLFGILHDTTVLTHPYVSTDTMHAVAYLIDQGATYHEMQKSVLKQPIATLETIATWRSKLQHTPRGLGYLFLTYDELADVQFPFNELFRQLRQIMELQIVCLVVEKDNEFILHFQSDSINLHPLLQDFAGGGHAFASKVRVATKKESYRVIETVDQLLQSPTRTLV